jgi:CHAT domain-containing protein/tetratricopeptide (TPR) repeat protein
MQTKALLVCLALMLPSAGTVRTPVGASSSGARPVLEQPPADPLYQHAMALVARGDYLAAVEANRTGWQEAEARGDSRLALRFLNNLGNCWYVLSRYRRAMEAYLKARDLAERLGLWEISCPISLNLSSLYLHFGDVDSAVAAARRGWDESRWIPEPRFRFPLLMQMGKIRAYQGNLDRATEYFSQAISEADRQASLSLRAQACAALGHQLLKKGRIQAAEGRLIEAFRLQKLTGGRELDRAYRFVGLLRMVQGDLESADVLLSRSIEMAPSTPGPASLWSSFCLRGQTRLRQRRTAEALADFRHALDLARRWRLDAIPADAARLGADVELRELYAGLIQAVNRAYIETRRPALVEEGFEAAEESRAASLRELIAERGSVQAALPDGYGETLARLRMVEASLLKRDAPSGREQAQLLRAALNEIEARTGLESAHAPETGDSAGLAERTRQALGADEALFSFHLGEPESFVWAVAREGVEVRPLAARSALAPQLERFAEAVRSGSPAAAELGQKVYAALFGGVASGFTGKRNWALAVEDALFRTPLAALVVERGPDRPVYLVERHSLRFVPSAHGIANRGAAPAETARSGRFVGLGDAVYNAADPRWRGPRGPGAAAADLELPRLPGSGREIRACAAAWGGPTQPALLEGAAASREELSRALAGAPEVVHLAAHVISRPSNPPQGVLALSLLPGGEPDVLTPTEIAAWRIRAGMVVLSGCESGAGGELPGAGLMGLTRAWLAAGAETVAAALWSTPDDSGELFRSFYQHLHQSQAVVAWRGPGAACALASAQAGLVQRPSWRSAPKYWAGYFLFGRE